MFYRMDFGTLARKYGKRHVEILTKWVPSMAIYGATAFTALCYFTDWKVIVKQIPYYNSKFKD